MRYGSNHILGGGIHDLNRALLSSRLPLAVDKKKHVLIAGHKWDPYVVLERRGVCVHGAVQSSRQMHNCENTGGCGYDLIAGIDCFGVTERKRASKPAHSGPRDDTAMRGSQIVDIEARGADILNVAARPRGETHGCVKQRGNQTAMCVPVAVQMTR
ncbi:MAG: hypothetical protein WCE85_16280 [Paraburkholderia sp.]